MAKFDLRHLADTIYTKAQLEATKDDLRTVSAMAFKLSPASFASQIKDKVAPNLFMYIQSLETSGRLPKPATLGRFLGDLEKYLSGIETVSLTLAFAPSAEFQKEIVLWLEKNLGRKVIVDFLEDEAIVAGAVIEYRGKFKDYSKAAEINSAQNG